MDGPRVKPEAEGYDEPAGSSSGNVSGDYIMAGASALTGIGLTQSKLSNASHEPQIGDQSAVRALQARQVQASSGRAVAA